MNTFMFLSLFKYFLLSSSTKALAGKLKPVTTGSLDSLFKTFTGTVEVT